MQTLLKFDDDPSTHFPVILLTDTFFFENIDKETQYSSG